MRMSGASSRSAAGRGLRFAVAVSRFNEPITRKLLAGCLEVFEKSGVAAKDVRVHWVPGAFELPLAALRLARGKKFHAVLALGCIIRGQTPHDRYIAQAVSMGLMRAGLDTGVPVVFGVLTPLNENQALDRAGSGRHNKGAEAALAALEMANALKDL